MSDRGHRFGARFGRGSTAPEMPPMVAPPTVSTPPPPPPPPRRPDLTEPSDAMTTPSPLTSPSTSPLEHESARDRAPALRATRARARAAGRAGHHRRDRPHRSPDAGHPGAQAARHPRQRPGHLDVQPEGRRRQDHDHDQPRCVAGRVRPQGAAGRLRPAGLALGRAGAQPPRDGPDRLQPADAAGRDAPRGRRAHRRARHGPASLQHRPVGRRGAAGARGGPRADPACGCSRRRWTTTTSSSSTASPRSAC